MVLCASDGSHVSTRVVFICRVVVVNNTLPRIPAKIKAYELRSNKKEGMLKKLEELKNELGQVRLHSASTIDPYVIHSDGNMDTTRVQSSDTTQLRLHSEYTTTLHPRKIL